MFNHYAFMNRDSWEDIFQILFGGRMSKGWASPGGKGPAGANIAHTDGARGVQAPREEGAVLGSAGRLGELPC